MAATVMKEIDSQTPVIKKPAPTEVECAECDCCGLVEECTPAYIARVRERYHGRWICGLCAEAVKDEGSRLPGRDLSTDEALSRHMKFCEQFRSSRSSPPAHPAEELISAMKQLLRRTLDSPTKKASGSPPLLRSKSCFSSISK